MRQRHPFLIARDALLFIPSDIQTASSCEADLVGLNPRSF
jgi:hypothetical protein